MSKPLTPRETEVLSLYARGYQRRDIAIALDFAPGTVQTYAMRIRDKLQVRSLCQAAAIWSANEAERLLRMAWDSRP